MLVVHYVRRRQVHIFDSLKNDGKNALFVKVLLLYIFLI